MFSGGIGSWAAAKRVAEQQGTKDLVLLFADTKMEDEDLYRFLREAATNVGGQLVKLAADGSRARGIRGKLIELEAVAYFRHLAFGVREPILL